MNRDTVELLPLIAENAVVQPLWMDGIYASGKKDFIRFWKLASKKDTSVFWKLLSDILQIDGMYANPQRMDYYLLPRYDPKFRQDAWLVMKDSLAVYSEPNTKSEIVRWLPKGTAVANSQYLHDLPAWIRYFDHFSDNQQGKWIQTNALYIYNWHLILLYQKGKWQLTCVCGFEYLYPKSY